MNKTLPLKHLSVRVPWHDNKWNGNTCCSVLDNSFCRILPRIDSTKNPDKEPSNTLITEDNFPPCISEKGTFLSPNSYTRQLIHSWVNINELFEDFRPGIYFHKPFSLNAVPFLWMMKSKANSETPHFNEKAVDFELDYDISLEQKIDNQLGFEGNIWVQHPKNQKVLLDAFFGCLKKRQSLIFFYCKDSPFSEPNERIIVGVAKVKNDPGTILEYGYDIDYKGHKSHPWDRCIEHTLTPNSKEGFLLPYHSILEYAKHSNIEINLSDYAAFASDHKQFSFASELVEHDTAIDSLLNIAEVLRKSELLLGLSFRQELDWIDSEISAIWDMRGAFPGMGSVLSALGIRDGNTIAWEIEKYILQKDNDLLQTDPWLIFEESIIDSEKFLKARGANLFDPTVQKKWNSKPSKKRELLKLLSRCQLNNEQADFLINSGNKIGSTQDIVENLYLIYERTRFELCGISFRQIDKALLPPEKIRASFPLPPGIALEDNLDSRRIRAFSIFILEEAASFEGHSLLPFDVVLERMKTKCFEEYFPIDEDILLMQLEDDFFTKEISSIQPNSYNPTLFLKLNRLAKLKELIRQRINFEQITSKPYKIEKDWLEIINSHNDFATLDKDHPDYSEELIARTEKAEALKVITNYKFSVLIGPAGSGKTSLLEIFEKQDEIQKGGILKLAPTGKARVKLGHKAMTLAQFLIPDRYNPLTGIYGINEDAAKFSTAKNIIIDEASMLTEEQLASLLDALGPVDRIVLVGDHRQLPPIGTGRPFVDIVNEIKPKSFDQKSIFCGPAYAELVQIKRQNTTGQRLDVDLSRCFSDNVDKGDIELFDKITSENFQSKHLRLVKWYESKDFRKTLEEVIIQELNLDISDVSKSFNSKIGAIEYNGNQYFNRNYAEKEIEKWQVISPVNGYGYGVKEVNKFFQATYRKKFVDLALNINNTISGPKFQKRKIAKPKGNDNIVYGDKVINLRNTSWENWQGIKNDDTSKIPIRYIANGEIGVITGDFRNKYNTEKGEPNVEVSFSTQAGYSYVFKPYQFGEDSKYNLELAYAITVHKSQGSGFDTVFFIMPSKGAILSRELLYTALTRQKERIIILHQGDFREFIRFASTDASSTARRFTDLYNLPEVKQLKQKWYDARYINISERGEPMLSKNEVIIANCLNKYKNQITYAYEDKLKLDNSNRTVKPDFTIDNIFTGKRFYWEHLGMMTKTDYRVKWQEKLKSYIADGFVLHHDVNENDEKILIVTEENVNGGINSQFIDETVRKYILK